MSRYACGLSGCESDDEGEYSSLEDCKRKCHPSESRDVLELSLEYNPEASLSLAPKDRIRLIKRITGVTVPTNQSRAVVRALATGNEENLALFPIFWESLKKKHGEDFLRLAFTRVATPEAYQMWDKMASEIRDQVPEESDEREGAEAEYYDELAVLLHNAIQGKQDETVLEIIKDHGIRYVEDEIVDNSSTDGYEVLERLSQRGVIEQGSLNTFMLKAVEESDIVLLDYIYRSSHDHTLLQDAIKRTERHGISQEVRDWAEKYNLVNPEDAR